MSKAALGTAVRLSLSLRDMLMHYLDHNATSPIRPDAREAMKEALEDSGNASSVHMVGRRARARVEIAREKVAQLAGAKTSEVIFTSGGTEANALALRGAIAAAQSARKPIERLVVSAIEHDSILSSAVAIVESDSNITLDKVPVDRSGRVDPDCFRQSLRQGNGRALVSVMLANNETGALQPSALLAQIVREECDDAVFHIDAVQAAGRVPLSFGQSGAQLMTISSHKIGGPQGAAALFVRDGTALSPLFAGAQENGRRAGTENVAAIAGFGSAAESAVDVSHLRRLRDQFEDGVRALDPDVVIFASDGERLPNTSNFAIPGLRAETALIALDLDGVALSSGAACSSGKVRSSHVLKAMGIDENVARCGLRLSLGWSSCESDIGAVLAAIRRLLVRKAHLISAAA